MSVLWLRTWPGEGGAQDRNTRSVTVPYAAETDNPHDGMWLILTHPDCPKPWQPHPEIPGLFVRRVRPEQRPESPTLWDIDVDYAPLDENPLSQKAKIRLTTTRARGQDVRHRRASLHQHSRRPLGGDRRERAALGIDGREKHPSRFPAVDP